MTDYRSVSQVKAYEQCPLRYKLERLDGAWQRPNGWLPMGTAVHAAVEAYELSGRTMTLEQAQEAFAESYAAEVARYAKETPNLEYWSSSWKYKAGESWTDRNGRTYESDLERRYRVGKEQVAKYFEFVAKTPDHVVWIDPDGKPGIELAFNVELGGVPMRGFVDQVTEEIVDVKTGKDPGDEFQLKIYQLALREQYGVKIAKGTYLMTKKGAKNTTFDLDKVPDEEAIERIQLADAGIRRGDFPARPGDHCARCSVNLACPVFMSIT